MTDPIEQAREDVLEQLRCYTSSELMAKLKLSRSGLFDLVRRGKFPQPLRLAHNCIRWREQDILDWLKQQSVSE